MKIAINWRHLATGTILSCATLVCCAGCTPKTDNNNPPSPAAQHNQAAQNNQTASQDGTQVVPPDPVPVPKRKPVATSPAFTFKFGEVSGNAYELKGLNFSGKDGGPKARTGALAYMQNAIYLYKDSQPPKLLKVNLKDESLSDPTEIGDGNAINSLTSNGKVVIFKNADKKLAVYDGTKTSVGENVPGIIPVGCVSDGEFYSQKGSTVKASKLEDTAFIGEHDLFNLDDNPQLKDMKLGLFCIDGGEIFMLGKVKETVNGHNLDGVSQSTMVAVNHQGQEVCRYTGFGSSSRDWAITTNYVIATDSTGQFRVFGRSNGQILGEFATDVTPLVMNTVTGNDVIVYDEKTDKLYRFDF